MCNLSDGIEERAERRGELRGELRGIKKATEETSERFILNMYRKGYTLEQIAEIAETSADVVEAVIDEKEFALV